MVDGKMDNGGIMEGETARKGRVSLYLSNGLSIVRPTISGWSTGPWPCACQSRPVPRCCSATMNCCPPPQFIRCQKLQPNHRGPNLDLLRG